MPNPEPYPETTRNPFLSYTNIYTGSVDHYRVLMFLGWNLTRKAANVEASGGESKNPKP